MRLLQNCCLFLELINSDLLRFHNLRSRDKRRSLGLLLFSTLVFSPRMTPVLFYRFAYFFNKSGLVCLAKFFAFLNQFFFGIEIASSCKIGPGLFLPHTYGTVIGAAFIGSNATIFQGSTLGAKFLVFDYEPLHRPKLGSGVTVGAGSKVLGDIYIGDNVTIGANAVVLNSIPANTVVVGIPARPR